MKVIRVLIEAGANVNGREAGGEYRLFSAAGRGHVGALRELLRAKADPLLSVPNSDGEEYLPLGIAAYGGHLEVVREVLQQVGIDGCGWRFKPWLSCSLFGRAGEPCRSHEDFDQRWSCRHGRYPQLRHRRRLGVTREVSHPASGGDVHRR